MKRLAILLLAIILSMVAFIVVSEAANEPFPDGVVVNETLVLPNGNPYLLLQTTGPNGTGGFGDPYKKFETYLTLPTGYDKPVDIIIYDPETWETSASLRPDERTGAVWDNMNWKLYAPDGTLIVDITYPPSSITDRKWINLTRIEPTVTGFGRYTLIGQDQDDDQSGFRILITPRNDSFGRQASLTFVNSSYEFYRFQGQEPPSLDAYYWAYVPSGAEYVVFGNFDLDRSFSGEQSITFFHPASGTTVFGTPSDNNEWAYDNITLNGRWGYWRILVNPGIPGNQWALTVENSTDVELLPPDPTDPEKPLYATIGDRVFEDLVGNGQQYGNETGVAGVRVELYLKGVLIAYTTTDNDGYYNFSNLGPETYEVKIIKPAGYNPTTPTSLTVTVTSGQRYVDADFGLSPRGSIGYLVWNDQAETQIPDPSKGFPSVNVHLLNGTTLIPITSTLTDMNGRYNFTDLLPGKYQVRIDPPPGTTVTTFGGNPYVNVTITTAGQVISTANFGLKVNYNGVIGNTVWVDLDQNGFREPFEPGFPGATVRLTPSSGPQQTQVTDSNGLYNFTGLQPGTYVVTLDVPSLYVLTTPGSFTIMIGQNEVNLTADYGIYRPPRGAIGDFVYLDPQGTGIPGIIVHLLQDGSIVNSTVTDSNGKYNFTGLPSGNYTVHIVYPANYQPTTPPSLPIKLGEDQVVDTADFGLREVIPGSIGQYVWLDKNRNGQREPDEPGIPGITVQLVFGSIVIPTVTDSTGNYSFEGLYPNNYTVRVILPPGNISTTPQVYIVKLREGEDYTQANFGLCYGGVIAGMKFNDVNRDGKYDPNIDTPVPGWIVELRQNGQVINTTVTDSEGKYAFTCLPRGVYYVKERQHPGWKASTPTEVMVIVNQESCPTIFHLYDDAKLIELLPNADISFVPESRIGGPTTYELDIHRFNPGFNVTAQAEFQWVNGVTYDFNVTYIKATNQVIYTVGGTTLTWSGPDKGFSDFAIRGFSGITGSSILVDSLVLKTTGGTQPIAGELVFASSSDGINRDILCIRADKLTGDSLMDGFTLTGKQRMSWNASNVPRQSNLAYQIKVGNFTCFDNYTVNFGNYQTKPTITPTPTPKPTHTPTPKPTWTPAPKYGSVTGFKFYDKDKDGVFDKGESYLKGVTIRLYNSQGKLVGTAITDWRGYFQFTKLNAGTYTVMEVVPKGYRPTTPTSVKVTVSGKPVTVCFGNVLLNGR